MTAARTTNPNATGRAQRRHATRKPLPLLVGIDTGGTFTDIVYKDGNAVGSYKLPSTPDDPARAVLEGLSHLFSDRIIDRLTYGTTVATNAMLQRTGARVALLTTAGFEDVIEIGRQNRPELYDLHPVRPAPLVPSVRRFGVRERVLWDGTVEQGLDPPSLAGLIEKVRATKPEALAICLLHSHIEPRNERALGAAVAGLGIPITLSHELSPLRGEFERSSTAVANAYVRPTVEGHLASIDRGARARTFLVMQSNGGVIGAGVAAAEPIRTMLSGPAGGVAEAFRCARRAKVERIVTLDMGGTSTDVALVEHALPRRPETTIAGLPVLTPCIDIHTVGAGGGSIAMVDEGGALRVGPESAGADPGPACYGKGDAPTVTDANVVLGRLRSDAFLGGHMRLDAARARRVLSTLARAMNAASPEHAAEGIVRVVEGTMERALRVITVERGQDPRTCSLVAFGGAAGLHACGLADSLGMQAVVIPVDPGLLSAWGVLEGAIVRDRRRALQLFDPSHEAVERQSRALERTVKEEVVREGVDVRDVKIERWVAVRYKGQSIELEVPLGRGFRRAFDRAHAERFHTSDTERSIEVTGLRATAIGTTRATARPALHARCTKAPAASVRVWVGGRYVSARTYARESLAPGTRIRGPAVVTEYSSTTLVDAGWKLSVDAHGNLVMTRRSMPRRSRV